MRMPTSTLSLRCTALAIFLASVGLLLAHQESQDATDPLARARALVEKGEHEAAAATLRSALEQAAPSPPPPVEWTTDLERIDSAYRATQDARRTGAEALFEIAADDRDAGWKRMASTMEGLAFALDPAKARARLSASGGSVTMAGANDDLQYYFGAPDISPWNSPWELADGELRLNPTPGKVVQCVGERTPTRFVLSAELHHDGTQASFGFDFDLREANSFLRAAINLRQGQIEPCLSAYGAANRASARVGARTPWSAGGTAWIPIELRFDGEKATLRAGANASALELRVPPRMGAGRLALFVEHGKSQQVTRMRALKLTALEEGR